MHSSIADFARRTLNVFDVAGSLVVEVGAFNVNGSVREAIEPLNPREYIGTDMREGPGVDLVCKAEDLVAALGERRPDVIVSVSTLEHVEHWREAVTAMKAVLRPGGLMLVTMPSPGYPLHDYPGDYWRYTADDMLRIWADFEMRALELDPEILGVMLLARKPPDWVAADLSGIELAGPG